MPRGKKNRGKKEKKVQTMTIHGPWGSTFSMPVGRIPITLGADRQLTARTSVYPTVNLDVPVLVTRYSLSAGAAAQVYPIDITRINAFGTRFASLFDEYCIVGVKLEVRLDNVTNPQGILIAFLDEKSSALPTAAVAQAAARLDMILSNTESPSRYSIEWKPRDYTDLSYSDTSTTIAPVNLKFYASNADTGTGASTSAGIMITGTFAFTFRGYK